MSALAQSGPVAATFRSGGSGTKWPGWGVMLRWLCRVTRRYYAPWWLCRLLGWNWQPDWPYFIYGSWQAVLEKLGAPRCPHCCHRAVTPRRLARHVEDAHGAAE